MGRMAIYINTKGHTAERSSIRNGKNAQRAGLHRIKAQGVGRCYMGVRKEEGQMIGDRYKFGLIGCWHERLPLFCKGPC